MMERVNRIWIHPLYQEYLKRLQMAEKDRKFCRHTPEHFLDVARLTWILVQEEKLSIAQEIVYAAALLHDIGRVLQYEAGTPHEVASGDIARKLLPECGFDENETAQILEAILNHRTQQKEADFAGVMYRADKMSRLCFCCEAQKECNWPEEKKNLSIRM